MSMNAERRQWRWMLPRTLKYRNGRYRYGLFLTAVVLLLSVHVLLYATLQTRSWTTSLPSPPTIPLRTDKEPSPGDAPDIVALANISAPLLETAILAPSRLWTLALSASETIANTPATLTITCSTASRCPDTYYILYYGPAAGSVPLASFARVSDTKVQALLILPEPGEYTLYAWPDEAETCTAGTSSVADSAVGGTPLLVYAQPATSSAAQQKHGASDRPCNSLEELLDARWLLTPEGYAYAPRNCALPHRTLSTLPLSGGVHHILFVGDSLTRDSLCTVLLPEEVACLYTPTSKMWEHGNKRFLIPHPTTSSTLEITFIFAHSSLPDLFPLLSSLATPPDVIIFSMGLWVDSLAGPQFRGLYESFFDFVDTTWGEDTHVVLRSPSTVVTPIRCFSAAGHNRGNAWRMRNIVLEEAKGWALGRGGKVGFVDAFAMTEGRMETSVDGVHWAAYTDAERGWDRRQRSRIGDAESVVVDWVLDEIVSGRSL